MKLFALVMAVLVWVSFPPSASAKFYRYFDESGGVSITNDYSSIPERFRANVSVITEKELEAKSKSRDHQEKTESGRAKQNRQQVQKSLPAQVITATPDAAPIPAPAPAVEQKGATPPPTADKNSNWLSRQLPLLKVGAIIALLITAAVYAGRLVSAVAPRGLAIIIRVAIFAALSVYIFKGFSEKVVDAFARIKEESAVAQKAVDKRSEKIQQQAE
jgi:hypothetical protein